MRCVLSEVSTEGLNIILNNFMLEKLNARYSAGFSGSKGLDLYTEGAGSNLTSVTLCPVFLCFLQSLQANSGAIP
jgi:hypothetical protein